MVINAACLSRLSLGYCVFAIAYEMPPMKEARMIGVRKAAKQLGVSDVRGRTRFHNLFD